VFEKKKSRRAGGLIEGGACLIARLGALCTGVLL
jgi:hypothetical protein